MRDDAAAKLPFNVNVLAMGQALGGGVQVAMFASAAIIGTVIAPEPWMATLPVTAFVVAGGLGVFPASSILKRFGYKIGFGSAGLLSTIAGLLYSQAVTISSFALLCFATGLLGIVSAFLQLQRFAASDLTPVARKPSAISRVMLGGVLAAVIGNVIAKSTKYFDGPIAYEATGYAMAVACMLYALLFFFVFQKGEARHFVESHQDTAPRPMAEIMRQPAFMAAVLSGAVGFSLMVLVMNAAPLAMQFCGIGFATSTDVITFHVLAMFGPSLFTGRLIEKHGVAPILYTGIGFFVVAAAVAISGEAVWQFYVALIFLGLGWNFLFVGGSSLLTLAYRASERAKVQSVNDFLILSLNAVASFSSALAIHGLGWAQLNMLVLPVLLVTLVGFLLLLPRIQRA